MQRRQPKVSIVVPVFLAGVFFIALLVLSLFNIRTANTAIKNQLLTSNRNMLSVSARLMFKPLDEHDALTLNAMLKEFGNNEGILYAGVRDTEGQIVADSRSEGWLPQNQVNKTLARQSFSQATILDLTSQNTLIIAGPITSGQERIGTLELVFDLTPLQQSVNAIVNRSLIYGGAILLGVVIFSVLFTQFATSQLRKLVDAANEIGRGNLDVIVPILSLEEAAIVGLALESMKNEVKKLYENSQQQILNVERRASYLEATANLASDAASLLDVQELISRSVSRIQDLFGYYRQSIFLLDSAKKWAVLRAAEGEDVGEILANGLQLEVGIDGIVGYVTNTGKPYVVQNVEEDPTFYTGGGRSETRSELVVPLIARGEIIGALDVQSKTPNSFSDEDMAVLQTLADQLAVAINNATLYQESQENFERLQRAYSELNREAWSELLRGQFALGFYCDENGTISLEHMPQTEKETERSEMSFPVTMRGGRVIGSIKAHKTGDQDEWATDEVAMLRTLSEQMSLALESAQLYQDTQRSATREQIAREITDKMRRATSVEDIIQTAVNELYLALGANQQVVAKLEVDHQETS